MLNDKSVVEEAQVVLLISSSSEDEEDLKKDHSSIVSNANRFIGNKSSELPVGDSLAMMSSEISKLGSSSTSNKAPEIPVETLNPRRVLLRSVFSKPKSRFVEPHPVRITSLDSNELKSPLMATQNSPFVITSPCNNAAIGSKEEEEEEDDDDDDEEEEEVYRLYTSENVRTPKHNSRKEIKALISIEWIIFVFILGCLIACLAVDILQHFMVLGLEIWKWCVLFMVILCGQLFLALFLNVMLFLIEKNSLLKMKLLYFVHGLRKSVQVFIWLAMVLVVWTSLFHHEVKRSKKATKVLTYVSRALSSCLAVAAIWMLKTLLVKILAASFHISTFFDRVQESIFHQYVLQKLSGQPINELAKHIGSSKSMAQLCFRSRKKKGKGELEQEVIDVRKLHKLKQEKVSAWTMKGLVKIIRSSALYTISNVLKGGERKHDDITSELEAKVAAHQIFRNVSRPRCKYIDEEDLLRFLTKEDVNNVLPLFEGAVGSGMIKKSTLRNWVVTVYLERKSLAYSLNDTNNAVNQLNKLVSVAMLLVIIIVWLLLMGLATTHVLLFISSQMVLVVFVFGNTAKIVFEAIIFVFVMHPFDVGDRCVIDGIQMTVEETNILTTVFLRCDNEKIYYPNSVLATKPISNFYRSPNMGDGVDFSIDVSTTTDTIGTLKARIKNCVFLTLSLLYLKSCIDFIATSPKKYVLKLNNVLTYIESKPEHWNPDHTVVLKEIVDVNKMQMALYFAHTMNHQNMGEKVSRKSELIFELKKIFEELSIKYHLLPQEVHLTKLAQQQHHQ